MTIQERLDSDYKIYNRFVKDEWREGTVEEVCEGHINSN